MVGGRIAAALRGAASGTCSKSDTNSISLGFQLLNHVKSYFHSSCILLKFLEEVLKWKKCIWALSKISYCVSLVHKGLKKGSTTHGSRHPSVGFSTYNIFSSPFDVYKCIWNSSENLKCKFLGCLPHPRFMIQRVSIWTIFSTLSTTPSKLCVCLVPDTAVNSCSQKWYLPRIRCVDNRQITICQNFKDEPW